MSGKENLKLTQSGLARRINKSPQAISNRERGIPLPLITMTSPNWLKF
ncbi:MAG TPA: hypothetical protein DDW50_19780 [Firmicutes bacterium]|nr:hypothetical protein [Bacillota bacterium]